MKNLKVATITSQLGMKRSGGEPIEEVSRDPGLIEHAIYSDYFIENRYFFTRVEGGHFRYHQICGEVTMSPFDACIRISCTLMENALRNTLVRERTSGAQLKQFGKIWGTPGTGSA